MQAVAGIEPSRKNIVYKQCCNPMSGYLTPPSTYAHIIGDRENLYIVEHIQWVGMYGFVVDHIQPIICGVGYEQ